MRTNRRNVTAYCAGESLWGLQMHAIGSATFLTVLLRIYGASETDTGIQYALEMTAGLAPMIGLFVLHSRRRQKRQLMLWHVYSVIPLLAVAGIINLNALHLPFAVRRWGLILSWSAHMWAIQGAITVWMDWASHLFPKRIRGRVFGTALGMFCLAGMAGTGAVGWLLKRYPGNTDVFSYVYFAAAAIASMAVLTYWLGVRDETAHLAEEYPAPPKLPDILKRFGESLAEPNFRRFLVGRVLAGLGLGAVPLLTRYYKSPAGGMLSDASIMFCGMALPLGQALASFALGSLGDRKGHRIGVVLGTAAQAAAVAVVLLSSGQVSCMVALFGMGIVFGSTWVSHINVVIESCPHEHRVAHITVSSILLAVPAALAAVAYGRIADVFGFDTLFTIWLAFSVAALAWMLLRVKEPRTLDIYRSE